MTSGKNYALSPAADELGLSSGLGDQITQQLQTLESERKKKLAGSMKREPGQYGDSVLGLAAQTLGLE